MASVDEVKASLDRRLASMAEYSLVQLRECRGPIALHAELVDGIRQDLGVVDSQLEELTLLAEDEDTEGDRQRAMTSVDHFKRQTESIRKQIREATLVSKRRIDSHNAASQREELFRSAGKTSAAINSTKGATSKDDELMSATANVTDGLRRTRQLMEQELEKSSLSAQMLERSSQTLTLTTNQYTSFSDLLQTSKNLITTLEKADTLDRLLITAALVFFLLVCLLIIKRRILDRGIRAATLVGKVAGGVGGVGKRGVNVMRKDQATAAASVLSASASVITAVATALATMSSTSTASVTSSVLPTPETSVRPKSYEDIVMEAMTQVEPSTTTVAISAEPTHGTHFSDIVEMDDEFDELPELDQDEVMMEGEDALVEDEVRYAESDATPEVVEYADTFDVPVLHIRDEL